MEESTRIAEVEYVFEGFTNPVVALGALLRNLSRETGVSLADDFDEQLARYSEACEARIDSSFDPGVGVYETALNLCRASQRPLRVTYVRGVIHLEEPE